MWKFSDDWVYVVSSFYFRIKKIYQSQFSPYSLLLLTLLWKLIFPGVDVTANQEEISDHETFQLEYDDMSKRWYIRTMQDKYFTQQPGGGIQAGDVTR